MKESWGREWEANGPPATKSAGRSRLAGVEGDYGVDFVDLRTWCATDPRVGGPYEKEQTVHPRVRSGRMAGPDGVTRLAGPAPGRTQFLISGIPELPKRPRPSAAAQCC